MPVGEVPVELGTSNVRKEGVGAPYSGPPIGRLRLATFQNFVFIGF
jgi:hypothetical protein